MRKRSVIMTVAGMLLATTTMAQEVPQQSPPVYNCDFQPSCEVGPGIYGKLSEPVQSKFKLSIGGFVKLDYVYNSVNFGPSGALTPASSIPKASSPQGLADQSIFTARQSRLWFKVGGPTFLGAKTNALIEFDFYGDASAAAESPQIRLRHAYGTLDWAKTQLLFGQTFDIFGPYIPSTLDFRAGNSQGAPQTRAPQVRLTQRIDLNEKNALKLVLGVQDPNQDGNNNAGAALATNSFGSNVNTAAQLMLVSKALGTAPGFWGLPQRNLEVGFFGLYGSQKIITATGYRSVDNYGYGFYAFVPILASSDGKGRAQTLSFEGQVYQAANMTWSYGTATALAGTAANPKPAKGYGFGGQFLYYPIQDLGFAAGYSRRNAYNYSDYRNVSNFEKYYQNLFFNVGYDLNAAVRVMAEYQNLETKYGNVTNVPTSTSLRGTATKGSANVGRFSLLYFF